MARPKFVNGDQTRPDQAMARIRFTSPVDRIPFSLGSVVGIAENPNVHVNERSLDEEI